MNILHSKENLEQNLVSQLENLQNDKYISKSNLEKQEKINKKQQLDDEKKIEKEQNKAFKAQNRAIQQEKIDKKQQEKKEKEEQNEDDETQFLGKDRRQLLNRISQYRELFPTELKTFKIKKGSSVEELQAYILEIQIVIETNTIDSFLMDSVYSSLNLIEPLTVKTKFNIRGLSDLLKSNKQFNSLTKQMLLKYGCYSNVAPEYQILLMIVSSVYITINKNNNRSSIESYLNEKI